MKLTLILLLLSSACFGQNKTALKIDTVKKQQPCIAVPDSLNDDYGFISLNDVVKMLNEAYTGNTISPQAFDQMKQIVILFVRRKQTEWYQKRKN